MYYDIVGDTALAWVNAVPGYTIHQVTWSFSGEWPYEYQHSPAVADGAFVNDSLAPAGPAQMVRFYWGASGGGETITANVTYINNSTNWYEYGSASIQVDVAVPANYVLVTPSASPVGIYQRSGMSWLSYGDFENDDYGIKWDLSSLGSFLNDSSFTFVNYDASVVQVFCSGDWNRSNSETNTNQAMFVNTTTTPYTYPRPLVDTPGPSPFYPAAPNSYGSDDSPGFALLDESYNTERMNMSFKDYVMYKPSGGIWVPVANWTWTVDASTTWNATNNDWDPPTNAQGTPDISQPVGSPLWPTWVQNQTTNTYMRTFWKTV
jgi:hypothetical protein